MPVHDCPFPACSYQTSDVSDVLAATMLQIHSSGAHASSAATTTTAGPPAKVEKVRRPTVSHAGTSEDWSYFLTRWADYKEATKLTGKDLVIQLLECCDEDLRKDLTNNAGGSLTNKTENAVLEAIKTLAVREESTMVARVTLYEMRQDRDETIRSFGARIRGQANICKYTLECPNCSSPVNYSDHILRDVLSRGIADSEIQLCLLGDANQNMTLEEVFKFVEAKEAGKRSANRLIETHTASLAAARSQHRRAQSKFDESEKCSYCGKHGHGRKAPPNFRKNNCPAYGQTCNACNRLHHVAKMCRSKDRVQHNKNKIQTSDTPDQENAVFDSLCTLTDVDNTTDSCSILLEHHVYSSLNKCWEQRHSQHQPVIKINACTHPDDYFALGLSLSVPAKTTILSAVADTGCQSCLIGMNLVQRFDLRQNDLIPVKMRMRAANENNISIIGAVILRLTGKSESGRTHETREMVYVTHDTDKLFLSREACQRLGMIPSSFPTIGDVNSSEKNPVDLSNSITSRSESAITKPCCCPRRQTPPPKPTTLPLPATEKNREQLRQWLLRYYASSSFNTCDHQTLPMMEGPPLRLMINPNAEPVAFHSPIPVPLHWQEDVKAGLDQDTRLGVIEPVPIGEPVTWCHRMVICAKKNGKPRRTIDFQPLNVHATRETHHTQSPFHQARTVPHAKKKTVFDCWNGYHSIPLHEEDRHFTTFITPWGRYRYRVAPQGYIASGDGYSRRFDEIVSHVPNKTKCIDDTLLWSDTLEESFFQAVEWLDICGRHGIILNPDKFVFGEDAVTFAGFEITNDNVRPCRRYIDAIRDFPKPRNITDMRSWFGLINQVSYAFASANRMLPFRQLLKPGTPFTWTQDMDQLFEESKEIIIKEVEEGVRIFDKSKPTCLATDWSKAGIGFWLIQKHCNCKQTKPFCCADGWKTTLVGSRFTHPAESRYAPIEGEALAVADALEKTRFFILGCQDLILAVDHKPLLKVLGDRSLNDIPNNRLRNLKEKTLRYRFKIVHVPGAKHKAADTLSRNPTGTTSPQILPLPDDDASIQPTCSPDLAFLSLIRCNEPVEILSKDDDIVSNGIAALDSLYPQAITWDKVKLATSSDTNMQDLIHAIEFGFPKDRNELKNGIQEFHRFRDDLSTIDGVVMYKQRIIIPPSLRNHILATLHSAHQGRSSMLSRAEGTIFWPGITNDISELRNACHVCNQNAPSQPSAPPTPLVIPAYPFQCVCADYFTYKGCNYLVIVDRYSNWPIIERAHDGAKGLIVSLRRVFTTFGIPDELASDGGPEFSSSSTTKFLQDWGVHHRLSSVAFPHSNSRAEIGVKTAKRLIASNTSANGDLNTNAFQRAILQHRNTPDPDTRLSPAMCVFGRPIKDCIPILPGRYQPHPTWIDTLNAREAALRCRHQKAFERWAAHTRRLPPLKIGDQVRLQNQTGPHPMKWDKTGTIVEVRQFDQYVVRIDGSGRVTLRNRKFLRKYLPVHTPIRRHLMADDLPPPHQHIKNAEPFDAAPPSSGTPNPEVSPPAAPTTSTPDIPTRLYPDQSIDGDAHQHPDAKSTASDDLPIVRPQKPPLALRRLMDFNAPGRKELSL